MKQFDQKEQQADLVGDARKDRPSDAPRRAQDTDLVVEALHRLGDELPLELARARATSPVRYRQAVQAMDLGPLGGQRLDQQIALLAAAPDHDIAAELRRRRGRAEALHAGLRARAERSLGIGLGHVEVYRGPGAQAEARSHGAAAFAHGHAIVLGDGVANAPSRVMAEEVAHVAQQRHASPASTPSVTSANSPIETRARSAAPSILAGRHARVGSVGRRAIMRVERESVSEEDRNARDLSPQVGSMESRSEEELKAIVNDERGQPRYARRGYLFEPQNPGAVTLELWLAAYDELEKRKTGPRGKEDDRESGQAHRAQGEAYAPDESKPVQRKARGASGARSPGRVARTGFRGGGQALPYLTQLQRSFGRHDLGGVRAFVGPSAALASRKLGATAYAMGERVAFGQSADLHTAAHEAAHVVQQRRGVHVPGGVSGVDDAYERHADRVADEVMAGASVEHLLDASPVGGSLHAVQRHPDRNDEDWTPQGDVHPGDRHVLHGTTRRFAALLHIYQSNNFGRGGLTPDTVVTTNGLTLEELYTAYREDRVTCTNSTLDVAGASTLVRNIREHGFVDNDARAAELGLPLDEGGFDGPSYRRVNLETSQEHQVDGSIDERLSSGNSERSGLRTFIQQGPPEGRPRESREDLRERGRREVRVRDARHTGGGQWTDPSGTPLSEDQVRQLRTDLPRSAQGTGALRGQALEDYRRYLQDDSNPVLDPASWSRQRRQGGGGEDGGTGGTPPAVGGSRRGPGGTRTQAQQDADGAVDPSTPPSLSQRQLRLPTEQDRLDEQNERVVRPGDREELERRIRARRREGHQEHERVARPGDREEFERRVQRARGVEVEDGPPHPQTVDPSTPPSLPAAQADQRDRSRPPTTSATVDREGGDLERQETGRDGNATTTAGGHLRVRQGGGSIGGTAGDAATGRSGRVMGGLDETADGGTQASGTGRYAWRTRGGGSANVEGGLTEERGPDGELRGRSASLGGGSGDASLALSAGYRCFAERPHQDPSNPRRFTIAWTISITREFAAEYRIGVSVSQELERTGTEVFVADSDLADDLRATERLAETWRSDFQGRSAQEVADLFGSTDAELNTPFEFWQTAEVGTARQVASQLAISASLEVPIFALFSIGGSYEGRWRDTAGVVKADDQHLQVTQVAEVRDGASASGGTFGASLSSGGRVIDTVTVVTRANLTTGETAIRRLLDEGHDLDTNQDGVQLMRTTRDQGSESTSGSSFGTLGVSEEGGVSHETGQERGPDGELRDVDIYHGRNERDERGLFGERRRSRFRVDAPVSGEGNYVVSQRISSNMTRGARDELARATDTRPDGGGGNSLTSGEWTITEEFSRDQIERFTENFTAQWERTHGAEGLGQDLSESDGGSIGGVDFGGGGYGHLYHELRELRSASGAAAEQGRARAIAEFLETEGQAGVRAIRHYAGGSQGRAITFTDREGRQDENLMTLAQRHELDASLASWETQVDDLARTRASSRFGTGVPGTDDAPGAINSAADADTLRQQIERQLTLMRERRAALDDHRRYGSLPLALRDENIRDYDAYIGRLDALLERLNTAGDRRTAAQYSTEAQADFEEMQAARDAAEDIEREVESTREFSVSHRRYFGQEPSEEHEADIGPRADARTRALWTQAELSRDEAREALRQARMAVEESRDRPTTGGARFEGTMQANWRNAREAFERATAAYQQARAKYFELNQMYTQLREHERPIDEPDPNPDGTLAAPADEHPDDATTPAPSDTQEEGRDTRARRRRRRRRRTEPTPTEEPAAERRQLVPFQVRYDDAGRHIHVTGVSSADIDDGMIEASHGLGIRMTRASLFAQAETNTRLMDRLRAAYGDGDLYHATYVIAREAPGIASFQVGTGGVAVNSEGEVIQSYAWVTARQRREEQ